MMKIFQLLTLLLAGRGATATQDGADILDIARDTEGFSTLAETLDASGLAFVFDQNFVCTYFGWFCHEYTVFAPTDDAFAALGEDTLERLLDEDYAPHLRDILLYHAVPGEILSADIADGAEAETLNHETVTASVGGGIQLNGDANVVQADIEASNGVVHVIDSVLLPSSTDDIATIAAENGSFTILVSLLERVGLVDFVRTTDKLTVFAPTDDAFDGVDADALTDAQVEDILTYHVVQDKVLTKLDLLKSRRSGVTTVQGGMIDVDLVGRWWSWNKELKLNDDVGILISDVLASNGIVHAIDSVLIPPSDI